MKDTVVGLAVFFGVFAGIPLAAGAYLDKTDEPTSSETTETLTAEESDYVAENGTSECTSDCSGHDAGYEWAEENDICDPEYDNGNSNSFNEGVQAYAEDNCYYSDGDGPI